MLRRLFSRLFFLLLAATLLRSCVFEIVRVNDNTMQPLLKAGDLVFVDKLAYGLRVPGAGNYIWPWSWPKLNQVVLANELGDPPLSAIRRIVATQQQPFDTPTHKNLIVKDYQFALGIRDENGLVLQYRGPAQIRNLAGIARFVLFPKEKSLESWKGSLFKPI